MKRLLKSLPIVLLTLLVLALPAAVHGVGFPSEDNLFLINQTSFGSGSEVCATSYQESELPEGLTLTEGSPFISPASVKVGDPVTVKIVASNSSTNDISHQLSLQVNGQVVGTPQQISVAPGETKDILLQFTASTAGTNAVVVGPLSGTLNVSGGSFLDTFPFYLWVFLGIVLVVIILMVVLLILKPKKRADAQLGQGRRPVKGKEGKIVKPGVRGGIAMSSQGMPQQNMPGMPESFLFGQERSQTGPDMMRGQPFPGQSGMQQFGPGQGPSGLPFPQQFGLRGQGQPNLQQPGTQPPFPPQTMPAEQQPLMGQGIQSLYGQSQDQSPTQQSGVGGPQFPQQPPMAVAPQSSMGPGMQPPFPSQGGYMGQQPPAGPGISQPFLPGQEGMQPPMQTPGQPPMSAPVQPQAPFGMPPPMGGGYQTMGMPKFAVSNLTITPNKVKVGEPVNISVIVSNNGVQTGKYSVVLRIGGVVENISDVTLPAGARQTASFNVVKDAPGDYYADIDGLGGFFTVIPLNPAAFVVSNFSIEPERVRQGQPVTVSAMVTNTGEVAGSHTLTLRIKGIAEGQQEVTLEPGKIQNIDFQVVKDTPGFYPVSLENWTGKFVVEMDWTG